MCFIILCLFGEGNGLVVLDVLFPINLKALLLTMERYFVAMK